MLQIPIIPQARSGEESQVLQIVCPLETDLTCDPSTEEIRRRYDCDELDFYQDDEDSLFEIESIGDTFFSYVRAMEEQSEIESHVFTLKQITQRSVKNEFSHVNGEIVELHDSIALEDIFETSNYPKMTPPSGKSAYMEKEVTPNNKCQQGDVDIRSSASHESYESASCFSTSTSSQSLLSYSNSSILKLKARKRKLEKHLNESLLQSLFSMREVRTTEDSVPCTFVAVA